MQGEFWLHWRRSLEYRAEQSLGTFALLCGMVGLGG